MSSSIPYTIPRGNFSDLGLDKESAYMLSRAYTQIEAIPGAWDILARPDIPGTGPCGYCGFKVERRPNCRVCDGKGTVERGFMFSDNPLLNEISDKVGSDPEMGHSGSSYAWTMRNIESIAKNGWENYTKKFPRRKLYASPEDVLQAQVNELTQRVKTLEAENEALLRREIERPSVMEQARAVDAFIGRVTPTALESPAAFADAIRKDPSMRAIIPDIDEQADAMKAFSEGKMSYAEMRSRCG